jgi:hypothetical protein
MVAMSRGAEARAAASAAAAGTANDTAAAAATAQTANRFQDLRAPIDKESEIDTLYSDALDTVRPPGRTADSCGFDR